MATDLLRGRWGWLIVWGSILALLGLVVLALHLGGVHPWDDVAGDRVAQYHHEQCENVDPRGVFLQFHNFWSNSGYLAVGLLILFLAEVNHGRFVGFVFVLLAIGSAWFHGTLTGYGQTLDMMGVYAALLAIIAYGFVEMVPLNDSWVIGAIMGASLLVGGLAGVLRTQVAFFDSDYFTPFLVVIIVGYLAAGAFRRRGTGWPLVLQLGVILVVGLLALVVKFTDGTKNLFAKHDGNLADCFWDQDGFIQGHALWHGLSAVMFLCMFEFFRYMGGRSRSVFPWLRDLPTIRSEGW